jgi:hypothetical protein
MISRRVRHHGVFAAVAAALASPASAVSLDPEGLGQALIFPYYTVRASEGGNAYNTYISIVSSSTIAKTVRVRFREGRAAKAVLDFNLYLSPNDVWTAALVPVEGSNEPSGNTRLLTRDRSCTAPAFPIVDGAAQVDFSAANYAAAGGDGFGSGLERTREGYVEVIEMAALSGVTASAITHNSAGVPANCGVVQGNPAIPAGHLLAPRGLLSGTGTLINVVNGRDFAMPAVALAQLATRPFYRAPNDPYPDFSAAEIDRVSIVEANGQVYRSDWERGIDAVSAVLMRSEWMAEYVLDTPTRSLTDVVAALPTRHHYVDATSFRPPFSAPGRWDTCGMSGGEPMRYTWFDRNQRGSISTGCSGPTCTVPSICAAAAVGSLRNHGAHIPPDTTRSAVLGSTTLGFLSRGTLDLGSAMPNGWIHMSPAGQQSLTSLPSSIRVDLASGQLTSGPHAFSGLPVVGFVVRTFTNGTLSCTGAPACQGNYGGAFPFRYRRSISSP